MRTETHKGNTKELEGLSKMWGLGRIVQNCLGIHGEYVDWETGLSQTVLLGHSQDEAIKRMNHVKSFL